MKEEDFYRILSTDEANCVADKFETSWREVTAGMELVNTAGDEEKLKKTIEVRDEIRAKIDIWINDLSALS